GMISGTCLTLSTIAPQIRDVISKEYGRNYTPFAREYKTKAKNAQEAHEAIRPTDPRRKPDDVRRYLEKDQAAL
ncbi:MAG TPA: hypothetical protein PK264_17515, partial [Hyphomicrobiaceae bacterium]|nr:hypothetical protein [Hyphomicrobiaceae bacterium]